MSEKIVIKEEFTRKVRKNSGISLKLKRKKLFKKFRADPLLWMERTLRVVDEEGNEVDFILNNVQREYFEELVRLYWKPWKTLESGEVIYRFQGIREVNQKARQFGLSTLICAIFLHDTLFFKNTNTYIFCQDETKSKEMLKKKVKFFWEHLPKSPLIVLPKTRVYNESVIEFSSGSQITALTPGSNAKIARKAGRSVTVRNALVSEVAEMEDAETLWQGLAPAIKNPSTNIFFESSPYPKKSGLFFKNLYEEGKKPESVWNSRFWAWWKYEKYQLPFSSEEEREAFQASITDAELVERELYDLSYEQLKWRRYMISFFGGGDKGLRKFRADFPANEKEGWETNASDLFFCKVDREVRLRLAEPQEPVEGRMYVITVDVAEGLVAGVPGEADDKKNRDSSVIDVYDPETRSQVYQWASKDLSIHKLHHEIYKVFGKYPGVVAIEKNGLGITVVGLCRLIKDPYFQRMLYWHSRTIDGWHTGSERFNYLVEYREQLEMAAAVYGEAEADEPEPDVPVGIRLAYQESVDEMDHFIDTGDGHPEARTGQHDDRIMTGMIANQVMKKAARWRKRHNKFYPQREIFRKEALQHLANLTGQAIY